MEQLDLYKIEAFRGTSSVDYKEIAEYLLAQDDDPHSDIVDDSNAEDTFLLATAPPSIDKMLDEAMSSLEKRFDSKVKIDGKVWYQVHENNVGCYPHYHGATIAFVYWAQTPPRGGNFCYYPIGMPGPELFLQPKAGDYIFFPCSLLHGVKRNLDTEPRVSISCNLDLI